MGGLQPCADEEGLIHRRSRLKIRRSPSGKISAAASFSSHSFSSFCHGRSCRQMINQKASAIGQPSIIHIFDPEVRVTDPAEFMLVVQRLTGAPQTRRMALRMLMRQRKETESSEVRVPDGESMEQAEDPLKEGTTIILAPTIRCSNAEVSSNDSPPSSTSPNFSDLGEKISQLPELLCANQVIDKTNPLAAHISSHGKQLKLNTNHPLSPISANSAISEENPRNPKSPKSSTCAYTTPLSSNSPLSPTNSSLTTSSLEGYHTDNHLSNIEEGGASSYREALSCLEQGNTQQLEEDGSINFFVFSRDSYYGNYHAAQLDEWDQLLNFSNALDPF